MDAKSLSGDICDSVISMDSDSDSCMDRSLGALERADETGSVISAGGGSISGRDRRIDRVLCGVVFAEDDAEDALVRDRDGVRVRELGLRIPTFLNLSKADS